MHFLSLIHGLFRAVAAERRLRSVRGAVPFSVLPWHTGRGTDGALARADRDRPTDGERRRAGRWPAEESRSIRQESRHRSPRTEGRAEAASAAASEGDVKGGYERRRSEDEGRTRPE